MLYLGKLEQKQKTEALRVVDWPARLAELATTAHDPRLKAFYSAGVIDRASPLSSVPLMAMDIETTGLDPVRDGILSIGLVPMSSDRIRASESRHWIVRPRIPLNDDSVTIHGITHTRIADAPDLDDVLEEVLSMMAGRVMVVHCRAIERQFLTYALKPRIGEGIEFPTIDTMELEARLHRTTTSRNWLARLFRRSQPVSIRLGPSRARYGLPRYGLHHALTDALSTAELLQAQIAHRFSPDTPVSELWG